MKYRNLHPLFLSLCSLSPIIACADASESVFVESVVIEPSEVITPAVVPVVEGRGFYFTADLICWKAQVGALEYAMTGVADGGQNVPSLVSTKPGRVFSPDFDTEPGFKLGAGYQFQHDGWDIFAQYTWLYGPELKNHVNPKQGLGAMTILTTVSPEGIVALVPITKGSSVWKQHFNVLDFELGRNFFISHRLSLRPFIGLKAAWISEELDCKFTTTETLPGLLAGNVFGIRQHKDQKMWGIGTRGGVDTLWSISKSWGVYGNFALTSLWSDFHVHAKDRYLFIGAGTQFNDLDTGNTITEVSVVFETGIGFTYLAWFKQGRYQMNLKAGWEQQVWFDFNHFGDFARTGNLTLQGLTMSVGFAF